jgi:superfamily II DNA or RNA helicase
MPASNSGKPVRPRRRAASRITAVATTGSGKTAVPAAAVTTTVESAV